MLMNMDNEYKNDKSKRIPAGADKKHKKKRRNLKHNYKESKDRKYEKSKKKLENKQEEILANKSGIQNKLNDSPEKIIKKANEKSDSRTGTSTITEVKSEIEKVQNVAAKNNVLEKIKVKKGKGKNKFGNGSNNSESEKKRMKERYRSEKEERKKLSQILKKPKKNKDKKEIKKHTNTSKNMNEQRKMKKRKIKTIKGQHHAREEIKSHKSKISNKKIKLDEDQMKQIEEKGKKKSKNTSKFKFKKKDEKMKHVDAILTSENEEKNQKMKKQGKLRSKRKPEKKLLEHQGKKDKLLKDVEITKQSSSSFIPLASSVTSTSSSTTDSSTSPVVTDSSPMTADTSIESGKSIITTAPITVPNKENKVSNYDNKWTTDANDGPTDKQKKEQKEQIAVIRKQPQEEAVKTNIDNGSRIYDVKAGKDFTSTTKRECERDRIQLDDRKIMRIEAFIQKNGKIYDMTRQPKYIQNDTNKITEIGSYTTQKPERKDNSNLEAMDSSSSSSSSETESESSEELEPNKIKTKDAMKDNNLTNESEHIEESTKLTISPSPDKMNTDTQSKESQDRSYAEGLIEIRTLLEIYGMEEEKREAFDKLLDEDIVMSDEEVAKNLSKAVCDLPINKELLEKVLKKMLFSGLLGKEEEEMLQKNLVPQAINESVTIALLAQVLQRQKLKK
ncbi:hypothetical protein ACO02O_10555 [Dirofilaria immitis]